MQSYLQLYLQAKVKNIALIANFFRKSKPVNVFNATILLVVLFVLNFLFSVPTDFSARNILEKIALLMLLLFFVLVSNFIIGKNALTKDNAFGALFVVLILGTFPETMNSTGIIIANIALLLALRKIYSLRSVINTKEKMFDAGLWIGIASLFHVWSLLFIWLTFVGLVVYKKIQIKFLLIALIGVIVPVLLYFTTQLFFDSQDVFYSHFQFDYLLIFSNYQANIIQAPLLFYGILLLLILFLVTPGIFRVNNKFKSTWQLFLNHLIIALIVVTLSPVKTGSEMLFLAFPLAIGIANVIERWKSGIFQHALIYLALGLVFLIFYL